MSPGTMHPEPFTLDDLYDHMCRRVAAMRDRGLNDAPDDMETLWARLRGTDLDNRETRLKVERIARLGRQTRTAVAVHMDEARTDYPSAALFGGSFLLRDTAMLPHQPSIVAHWATD
jgi:hypothetical protein